MATKLEKIELTYEEMDLAVTSLDQMKAEAKKVKTAAEGKTMFATAGEAQKFENKVEDLKTKFLHSN